MTWLCKYIRHRWMVSTVFVYHDGYMRHCSRCGATGRIYYNEATDGES